MAVAQHVRVAVGHLEVLRGALKAECLEATERDVDGDECAGGTEDCEDEAKGLRSGGRRRGAVRGGGHCGSPDLPVAQVGNGGDAVDAVVEQWRRQRPDLDPSAKEVTGRIVRLASLFQ
jgi:hypothetical protein